MVDKKRVFISYRRDGQFARAGWLASKLGEHFDIFRDIDIMPSEDFVEAIERALEECAVVLVVIGGNWADKLAEHERTGQKDYTRLEVASALESANVRVLPVLVQGASMPHAEELPDDLAAIHRRMAIELHDNSWERDVDHLITVLKKLLPQEPPRPPKVRVPDLSGQEIWQARNTLANKGLHLGARTDEPNGVTQQGKIIKQRPEVGDEVEEGSSVSITVSSGPDGFRGGRHWWALASRGVMLVIFGLLIAFFNDVPDALLYGATAMVYGLLVITNGIVALIETLREDGRRQLLRVESRVSLLAGSATLLVGLVAFVLYSATDAGSYIVSEYTGAIVFYIVAFWALCIGTIRIVAAIRLGLEFKVVWLMLISGALLVVFGVFLLLKLWDPKLVLGIWLLASGSFLLAFAFQVRDQERSGARSGAVR